MEEEREEGEIVDLNDDDIYENIISSDEEVDEDHLRRRIEELEAKNSELEKIASISKTYDYGLGFGSNNFIDLAADDDGDEDESYYPSKYEYSSYPSSRRRSRSNRRKTSKRECKKSKRYKPYRADRRKKTQPNRTKMSSGSSSNDEFKLDPKKLQAALKRNNTSSIHSTTLKRKLDGVSKTVEEFVKAKEDVGEEDINSSIEILQLLNGINIDEMKPQNKVFTMEEETETGLNEQELRIIALKSAILKKAEARKRRKIIETQPYSPTDDIIMENAIISKVIVNPKPKDELDNMEISPAVSPTNQYGSLQPIDMELESEDENQEAEINNIQEEVVTEPDKVMSAVPKDLNVPVPDKLSLSNINVPEKTNQIKLSLDFSQHLKQEEEEEERALRASLLAGLKSSKRKATTTDKPLPTQDESVPSTNSTSDAITEMEHLRKQVFSSIQKRKNLTRNLLPNPFAQKFSVQVPKPMEMSMPQITSNLKEALKRIKEKQNLVVDAKSSDVSAKIGTNKVHPEQAAATPVPKEIQNEAIKSHPEPNDDKIVAVKHNGVIASTKTTASDSLVKKSCEPSNKLNDVLKNVTCNNSSVETKAKEVKKSDTGTLEKVEATIRPLKTIPQKKVISEPHISLNQKENQLLRKVGASPKRTSEERLAVSKKPKVSNVKVSRVITTPVEKPVKKMIIQLNNSDTESDDLGLEQQSSEAILHHKSYSGVASPVSHSFSPSSPATVADEKSIDAVPLINDSFQRKLDEYLKSARTKVEQTKQETKPLKKSPSLVSHLPPSSQLEYRKLINRMALLEKQKFLKLTKAKIGATKITPSTNISITISNDLCNHQAKLNEQIVKFNGQQNTTEMSVPVSKDNVEVPNETRDEFSVPNEGATFANSEIKDNKPKAPVKGVAQRRIVSKTCENSEKSPSVLQNLSTLSEDDKKNMLQETELEYMQHSELYLIDLKNMSLLVNKARQEKEKQFQIESQIEDLQTKVEELKKKLVTQKISVSKLYPDISTSHKNIMKKRSRSLQLNKKCYCIGNKIIGVNYKIPGDPKSDIAQKVKSLSSETKLLRNMKKPNVAIEAKSSQDSICIADKTFQTEIVNHTQFAAAYDEVPKSAAKPVDFQESPNNCTSDNIPAPYSIIKYSSPLDHMKNIGTNNPDLIVCPFQLLGSCEDKECTYRHLS